ncbi:MAG: DDE-type integrase/transposase/recombinase [Gammaproteobacteria bacterium]
MIVTGQGKRYYLWRAVDQDDNIIDILVQKRKDKGLDSYYTSCSA